MLAGASSRALLVAVLHDEVADVHVARRSRVPRVLEIRAGDASPDLSGGDCELLVGDRIRLDRIETGGRSEASSGAIIVSDQQGSHRATLVFCDGRDADGDLGG